MEHTYENCHNLTCRRKERDFGYNQALEDFKKELIKVYNKRYMHDIYIDDIRGIVEQLKR